MTIVIVTGWNLNDLRQILSDVRLVDAVVLLFASFARIARAGVLHGASRDPVAPWSTTSTVSPIRLRGRRPSGASGLVFHEQHTDGLSAGHGFTLWGSCTIDTHRLRGRIASARSMVSGGAAGIPLSFGGVGFMTDLGSSDRWTVCLEWAWSVRAECASPLLHARSKRSTIDFSLTLAAPSLSCAGSVTAGWLGGIR